MFVGTIQVIKLYKLNSYGVSNLLSNELADDNLMMILVKDNDINDTVDNH